VCSREMAEPELMARIEREIVRPTVEGLVEDGLPYRGFLYFGIILTREGPKILEYNCRFGDPEAEAVLPLIEGDFASYVFQGASGYLDRSQIKFRTGWSVCLVSASAGYPLSSHCDDMIFGIENVEDARVFHAGTKKNKEGRYVTAGGRVLVVVASGETREEAVRKVYRESDKVSFDGMQRRTDIGVRNF